MPNLASFYQDFNSFSDSAFDRRFYHNYEFINHYHINPEIIYASNGSMKITINGIQMDIGTNQFCLVLPWQTHSLYTPENSDSVIFVFPSKYIQLFIQNMAAYCGKTQVFTATEAIHNMFLEYLCTDVCPDEYIFCSVLYGLCHCFLENCSLQNSVHSPETPLLIEIMNYLSKHYSETLSLKDVAEKFGYSYYYLSRLFRKNTSLSFHQFCNIKRIEQAAALLTDSDKSISEIAWQCGFANIRTFNRVFLQLMDLSPSKYRTEHTAANTQMNIYETDYRVHMKQR